jgi:hypothetical protein
VHEHHVTHESVPQGASGASRPPGGDDDAGGAIRRAMAEAELLRARIGQLQRDGVCDCPALERA